MSDQKHTELEVIYLDLSFINGEQLYTCLDKIENLGKMINGFIRFYKEK